MTKNFEKDAAFFHIRIRKPRMDRRKDDKSRGQRLLERLKDVTDEQYDAVVQLEHLKAKFNTFGQAYVDGVTARKEALGEWRYLDGEPDDLDRFAKCLAEWQGKAFPPELRPDSDLTPEELEYRKAASNLLRGVERARDIDERIANAKAGYVPPEKPKPVH
jgi:hypothetical protein